MNRYEKLVCSAQKLEDGTIILSVRHFDMICGSLLDKLNIPFDEKIEQGFITSHGRFLERKDAKILAIENGQVSDNNDELIFSEDLY